MTTGTFQSTGSAIDVGIQGEGFFVLAPDAAQAANPTGLRQYTRAGNFTTNANGQLVTQDGFLVVGYTSAAPPTGQQAITIPAKSSNVSIGQDGNVSYIDQDPANVATFGTRVSAGYIQLAKFANQAGLERNSGNRWVQSPASGTAQLGAPGGEYGMTVSGVVEMSNVDLAQSFTQHDHRPARLPGQLPRHLDLGRDAAGPGQPEALRVGPSRLSRDARLCAGVSRSGVKDTRPLPMT